MLEFAAGERFELQGELGKGGMGMVYKALDRERNALVALKTLQKASPSSIARFKAEFRSLTGLVHPHLVTLYELVVDGDRAFYTMELVTGVHFDQWVRPSADAAPETASLHLEETAATCQILPGSAPAPVVSDSGVLDMRRLRSALKQLAEGITAIHDIGKLHRDLKPSNVMVTPEGRVVVLDFGLVADLETEANEQRSLEGTASYMSPEQGARGRLTPASDWYALGVILYRALTGRVPFIGGLQDVLMDKQRFEPARPSEIAADLPADLELLCIEMLRREPERRPDGSDILRRLGSSLTPNRRPSTYSTGTASGQDVLIGRAAEVEVLERAWRSCQDQGHAVLVHVQGPSGMGKSRVTRAFLSGTNRQQQEPVLVLRGRCYETESLPFKAVDSLVDALTRYLCSLEPLAVEGLMPRDALALARVFPVLRQVPAFTSSRRREVTAPDPQELRRRAFAALRELFARISDRSPIVLAIDDVQWGDVDSAELLSALLRPPEAPALMLIMCWRSEAAADSAFLQALERGIGDHPVDQRELSVGSLSEQDTRELAAYHLGPRDDAEVLVARIATESQGNPFFVEEMARHVRESRGAVTVSLQEALRRRLARLPDEASRLLSIIAVAGRPIPQIIATRAAAVVDPSVLSLLKAGSFVKARSVDGARYIEPYHDRIRETVIAELDPKRLAERHLRLAHLFEASPNPDAERLATHYAGAGENQRAAEFAVTAAERAMEALAFDRAATLYRMAIELSPSTTDRAVRVALGDALVEAGRGAAAAEAYESAIDGASRADALDLRSRAAAQLLYAGHIEDGLARLNTVLADVGMRLASSSGRALLSLVINRTRLALRGLKYKEREEREIPASQLMEIDVSFAVTEGLGFSDPIRGADFHGRSVLLALRCGEPVRVHRALCAEAVFTSLRGVKAQRHLDKVLDGMSALTTQLDMPPVRALDAGARGITSFSTGHFAECQRWLSEAEAMYRDECVGHRFERGAAQLFHCYALALRGELRLMVQKFPELITGAYERDDLFLATNLRAAIGLYAPLLQDDAEAAAREIDQAMAAWPQRGFHLAHSNAMSSRAYVDMYRGAGAAAHERIEECWPQLERSKMLMVQMVRVMSWAARGRTAMCAYRVNGDKRARSIARKAQRKLLGEGAAYARAMGYVIAAGLAQARGDDPATLEFLVQAEAESERAGVTLHGNAVRYARGVVCGGDEGAELKSAAALAISAEGAVDPVGIVRVYASIAEF